MASTGVASLPFSTVWVVLPLTLPPSADIYLRVKALAGSKEPVIIGISGASLYAYSSIENPEPSAFT